ncbi:MAG: hypothetical protein QM504_07530 [Pseudomonadota bacterium]
MKKHLLNIGVITIFFLTSYALAGSTINKVKITNKSTNIGSTNVAIGSGATANMGSINIKGSRVSNMRITNKATNIGTKNIAIGGGTANAGSINID